MVQAIPVNLLAWQMAKRTHHRGHPGKLPPVKRGEEILAGPYPKSFADFVGQTRAREQIVASIASATKRGKPLEHMLLASGYPGIGKTTLARLTASLLNVGFLELGGTVGDKDVALALQAMQDGDVMFLDEVHRLVSGGRARAEWLLTLLQDGCLQLPTGVVEAPAITVIAATTDAQKLPETILDRFPLKPVLDPYTDVEAQEIALVTARRLGFGKTVPIISPETAAKVAAAAANNPRRMRDFLISVRDSAMSQGLPENGQYDLSTALEWNGLTADGLTATAQNYLVGLYAHGGTAGVATIKALLNEEQLAHTERHLIQRGLVEVTPRGRSLTGPGMDRARELAEQIMEDQ